MKLENVTEGKDEVRVTTTGATYIINKSSQGEISCYQRIGAERLVATLTLHESLKDLAVDWSDGESCLMQQPVRESGGVGIGVRINSDSTLSIRSDLRFKATYHGEWVPEYCAVERGAFMLIDEKGGVGAYPLKWGGYGYDIPRTSVKFSKDGWQISFFLQAEQRFLTSVFPPRPFEWEKSFKDRIVHHFNYPVTPYPQDDEIEEYSRYGNILVLHWWQHGLRTRKGKSQQSIDDHIQDSPWTSFHLVPKDEKELKRTVEKAHEVGMKVIPYMSPLYFPGETDEFLREMDSIVKGYQLDGVYFDGVSSDVLQGYTIMRAVRRLLGDKVLFVHVPSYVIGEYEGDYVYCPFIDTYADYILKAEHTFTFDWRHLRYTISGYNISNSIGFVCNYDYEPEFTRQLVKQVLKANARLSYWVGFDAYVEERQKVIGRKHYPLEDSRKIMREEYFPLLDAQQKKQRIKLT